MATFTESVNVILVSLKFFIFPGILWRVILPFQVGKNKSETLWILF